MVFLVVIVCALTGNLLYADDTIYIPTATERAFIEQLEQRMIYTPGRDSYVKGDVHREGCPFCLCMAEAEDNEKNLILARAHHTVVMLNLFPYTKGHLLIVPKVHVSNLNDLSPQALAELMALVAESVEILKEALHVDGVNIGINLGRIASASIPDHLHVQIVPRYDQELWAFMHLIGKTNVVYWDLTKLYRELQPLFIQRVAIEQGIT